MSRGTTVHIPIHYDARANPQSPSYDPAHADHGHITTHPNNPPTRQENPT